MGLFSNTKDIKKAVWLYEAHRCSACGELNAAKHRIILKYSYDEIASMRSEANRNASAGQKLDDAAAELIRRAADPEDIEKYYDLNLSGKCRKCGHKEPWSRMRWRLYETVFNALVAMSVIALIVGVGELFMGGGAMILLPSAGLIALTVGAWLLKKVRRSKREKSIAALKEASVPYLTDSAEAFRGQYPELDPDTLPQSEPSGYVTVRDI